MAKHGDPLKFYSEVVTEELVESLLDAQGVSQRDGIYKCSVVIWLMICQRLRAKQSMAKVLHELKTGRAAELLERANGSIRVRTKRISSSTGGYSQARGRIPSTVVEQIFDRLYSAMSVPQEVATEKAPDVYVVDGSTLQISHTEKNLERYSTHHNQHGHAHFPVVRVGVATNALNGFAIRPTIGAYSGPAAVSEITLAEELFARLPKGATVIGDRYYGCFRFAYGAVNNGLHALCRIKAINAKRFIGVPTSSIGEQHVQWTPTAHERKKYSELTPSAVVEGKFIWTPLIRRGYRSELFVIFTTLDLPPEKVFQLYALRWNVETDLRDIKATLDLQFINAQTPDMVYKEIILGIAAYNLIRHCISIAATAAKLPPRSLSFSMTLNRIHALGALLLSEQAEHEKQRSLQRALTDLKGLMIYRRKKKRPSEPRKIWPRGQSKFFSSCSSRHFERQLLLKQFQTITA